MEMKTTAQWLAELGLSQYAESFAANDLDFETLSQLEDTDLREVGVHSMGHRKKLLKAISALKTKRREGVGEPPPEGRPVTTGERRQITIMFCDLVGSTSLSTRLDAEDMDAAIRRYQEAVTPVIHEFGGHVARFSGDGILSYFGYPNALEREAERAIHAALRISSEIDRTELAPGIHSRVRVGIATGSVVIGGLYDSEKFYEAMATGETPNLAARLQSFVEPGGIAVCNTTRRLAGDTFSFNDKGRVQLKGFREEVRIWSVSGHETHAQEVEGAPGAGAETPLEGRRAEMARLRTAWRKASQGEGVIALLRGEAGVGKSRMLKELKQGVPMGQAAHLVLSCQPYSQATPFYPLSEALQRAIAISSDEAPEQRRERLQEFAERELLATPPLTTALLARLLGIANEADLAQLAGMSPQRLREETIETMARQIAARALERPLMVLIEDLHWADASTLQFLEVLASRIETLPALLLMTSRPEFEPHWEGGPDLEIIELGGLPEAGIMRLIDQVSGETRLPDGIRLQIAEKSDGIPLYVEELTRSMVDEIRHAGKQTVTEVRFEHASVPDALQNTLMARLDRLGEVKELALHCAVIGREFERELIALVMNRKPAEIGRDLQRLVDAQLLRPLHGAQSIRFVFRHALLRDAAYNHLLKGRRREIHLKVARVMEDHYAQRVATHPERLAYHLTQGSDPARAIPWWLAAGRRALQASANIEAVEHLRQGLALLDELDDAALRVQLELELRMTLGPALIAIRGFAAPEVREAFARAHEICESIGADEQLFPVLRGLMAFYVVGAEYGAALDIGHTLREVMGDSPSAAQEVEWHWVMASAHLFQGDVHNALAHLETGIKLYDRAQHASHALIYGQDPGVATLSHLAFALNICGRYTEALAIEARARELADSLGHPFSQGQCRGFTLSGRALRRELDELRLGARENLEFSRTQGFPIWQGMAMMESGWARVQLGDSEGLEEAEQGFVLYEGTGAKIAKTHYLTRLAEAYLICGDPAKGLALIEEAMRHRKDRDEHLYEAEAFAINARLLLKLDSEGQAANAESLFDQALEMARSSGARTFEVNTAMAYHQMETAARIEHGPGRAALESVLEALKGEPDVPILRQARTQLRAG